MSKKHFVTVIKKLLHMQAMSLTFTGVFNKRRFGKSKSAFPDKLDKSMKIGQYINRVDKMLYDYEVKNGKGLASETIVNAANLAINNIATICRGEGLKSFTVYRRYFSVWRLMIELTAPNPKT